MDLFLNSFVKVMRYRHCNATNDLWSVLGLRNGNIEYPWKLLSDLKNWKLRSYTGFFSNLDSKPGGRRRTCNKSSSKYYSLWSLDTDGRKLVQDLLLVPLQLLDEMLEIAGWLENSTKFLTSLFLECDDFFKLRGVTRRSEERSPCANKYRPKFLSPTTAPVTTFDPTGGIPNSFSLKKLIIRLLRDS